MKGSDLFIGFFIAVGIGLIILWYRWNKCRTENGVQARCVTEPCPFIFGKCNFLTGKLITNGEKIAPSPLEEYVAGQKYVDPETGKPVECYNATNFEPLQTIFKQDTNPPVEGKLYKRTSSAVCYIFDK